VELPARLNGLLPCFVTSHTILPAAFDMSDVTRLLHSIETGDRQAAAELLPAVYDELRKLAAVQLTHENAAQSLNATALVHEAWLRLVGDGDRPHWENRRHFFGAAATAIRRILVDRARQRNRLRHGGAFARQFVDLDQLPGDVADEEILALHEALEAFARHDEAKARLVELRFFAGMTLPEAAETLGISPSKADRAWKYARAWLYAAMNTNSGRESSADVT
jgi:RNA polymerase sigma factor (TIGR02999 family)